jgi:ubiquinone/menaquinone biosynthesis C-methylase UbiE
MAVDGGAMQRAFDRKVRSWVQYNASAGGRLRLAIILHHLQAHLSHAPLHMLDVGGGTGETAADLAKMGHGVTHRS